MSTQETTTMTERTENEHVAWIREKMDDLHQRGLMPGTDTVDEVIRRAKDLAARLAAAEAERDAERAKAARLRKALRRADENLLTRIVHDELSRTGGDLPSRNWVAVRRGTIESNHYANDGLKFGDLDGSDDDA